MGLLNSFNEWRANRHEKHLTNMKDANKCPECYGRGFSIYPGNEYAYHSNLYDCPGCNGGGTYSDWEEYQ
jgi:DnaJ-class molecular chaperone